MPSGRARVRMSPDEVQELLLATSKVQVATINPDGTPHLTTLFHTVLEGRLAFWTYASTQKVRNLERDPRLSCLVEDGEEYFELRGVSIQGTARIVRDEPGIREIGTAVAEKMFAGADLGAAGAAEIERQVAKRVGIVVTARTTASWDHRKLVAD
jgi:PPOX class probable F420-dependent enzyme